MSTTGFARPAGEARSDALELQTPEIQLTEAPRSNALTRCRPLDVCARKYQFSVPIGRIRRTLGAQIRYDGLGDHCLHKLSPFSEVKLIRSSSDKGAVMTWQELFNELSTTQADAFRAGDVAKVRHTIAGIETLVRNYQDLGCPNLAATVPEPIISHIRKEMALRFPGGGR